MAAGVVRLVNLARLTASPSLLPSRGDMHFYDEWAQRILRGEGDPHLAFYGLPGYPYLVALLYRVFGHNPFVPGLLQALLDGGTAVLIYFITLRLLRPRAISGSDQVQDQVGSKFIATIAALAWVFFVPAEAYSVILMPTAWFVFLYWWIVWRVARTDELNPMELSLLGFLIGLTATAVATILIIVPLVLVRAIVALRLRDRVSTKLIGRNVGLLLICIGIGTAPCWLHNYVFARDPVLLSAHSGINFWIGNNPIANGYPRFPPGLHPGQAAMLQDSISQAESAAGRPLKRAEVAAYWSQKATAYIRSNFRDWLELIGLKVRNFWSAFQYDDLSVVTNLREQGVIFPGFYFGVVAALGIPGLLFAAWCSPQLSRWIIAAVLLALAGLLPVFITERYRLVAVPGLLAFAAYGLVILWRSCAQGKLRTVLIYTAVLAGAWVLVSWPNRDPSLWALDAYNSGWQALEAGNLNLAEKKLAIAHAYVPTNPEINFALGNVRLAENKTPDAKLFFKTTLNLDPHHKGALNNLGVVSFAESDFEQAQLYFERALSEVPGDAKTHYLLAKTFYAEGQWSQAREAVARALALKPDQREFIQLKGELDDAPNH